MDYLYCLATALEKGISLHGVAPLGNLQEGFFTGDSKRNVKEGLGNGASLSL
jgi:hypothetical protein